MKPFIGWIVAAVLISFVIIFNLVTEGWWGVWGFLTQILALLVGILVGNSLLLGAYRLFGWGESAARSIYRWGWVGGGTIVLLVLVVLGPVLGMWMGIGMWTGGNEPNLATIAFWATLGVWVGSVSRAGTLRKQH
jgi:hypothetical protein